MHVIIIYSLGFQYIYLDDQIGHCNAYFVSRCFLSCLIIYSGILMILLCFATVFRFYCGYSVGTGHKCRSHLHTHTYLVDFALIVAEIYGSYVHFILFCVFFSEDISCLCCPFSLIHIHLFTHYYYYYYWEYYWVKSLL